MAYLGGFLLLVATLSFEVGEWQFLNNTAKLAIVLGVYSIFGGLGLALRNATRLRTVGRTYLGIFALMTPLVCLAVYRFVLQNAHFSGYGMLAVSSFYAAIVYLALGWRTRFITYSYLGWAALLVGALAIIPWLALPWEWATLVLALTTLVMLIPTAYQQRTDLAAIAAPGVQFAVLTTIGAFFGTELQGINLWEVGATMSGSHLPTPPSLAAFALATCALVPLAARWSVLIRHRATRPAPAILTLADWLGVALLTEAVIAVAAWADVDRFGMTYLLAFLAIAEFAITILLRQRVAARRDLRLAIDALGMVLALNAILMAVSNAAPNWSLVTALCAGGLLGLGVALVEDLPAVVLIGGFFCSIAYYTTIGIFYPASAYDTSLAARYPGIAIAGMAFTLGLWLVALALGFFGHARPFAPFTYLVATGNAIYIATLVIVYPNHDVTTQTLILLAFSSAALIAGWREHNPTVGGVALGFFGVLAVIPPTARSADGLVIGATVIVVWLAALGIRRALGRPWLVAPYVIAIWATTLAGFHLALDHNVTTAGWQFLGMPYVAWLLLAAAIPATAMALLEDQPILLAFPALIGLSAVIVTGDHVAPTALTLLLIAVGVGLRQWRGPGWGSAWHVAAAFASLLAVHDLSGRGNGAAYWQAAVLLGFAVITYGIAAQERRWEVSLLAVPYGLAALLLLPDTNIYPLALALGIVAAVIGMALRLRFPRRWTLATYSVAVIASLFASAHVAHGDVGQALLLLTFALLAYGVAAQERRWQISGVALPFIAAAYWFLPQRDGFAPTYVLALGFVIMALALRRRFPREWSLMLYGGALLGSLFASARIMPGEVAQPLALLLFALAAYLVAAQEKEWRLTFIALPYVLATLVLLPNGASFGIDLALTGGTVALGVALRWLFPREWALALYASAVLASLFAIAPSTPFDAAHGETLLLVFAVIAYIVVLIEQQSAAGVIPMLYAAAAIGMQPDAHALLPLALIAAVLALIAGQRGGWRWSWPLYAVAIIAALATVGHSQADSSYAALTFGILAVTTYVVAAVESRPDVVIGAFVIGVLTVATAAAAWQWQPWQAILAFAALSWLYTVMQWLWRALPWLRPRGGAWWQGFIGDAATAEERAHWLDPYVIGALAHRVSGLFLALGTLCVAFTLPDSFMPTAAATEGVVIALVSLAGILALQAMLDDRWHVLRYVAGGALALAATWQLRWLGADNVQAYILVPGSYQLLIGALLPADRRLDATPQVGQLLSLTGSLTLLLPTLAQSFQSDQNWIYAVILAAEAIVITGIGIGTRSRLVMAAGLAFVGLAAIRGGVLAVDSGVPIALVIGFFALLLMGAATWLSLRSHREAVS